MSGPTLDALLVQVRQALAQAGIEDAAGDARRLVQGILGLSSSELITRGALCPDVEAVARLRQATARRVAREPVHRILGSRSFHGLELALGPETLEPRADTEALVDLVIPVLASLAQQGKRPSILDLGTGTGAIALSLLNACATARALATDIAQGALDTAMENARNTGVADRFQVRRSHWFSAVNERFDVVVSNPPYIRSGDIAELMPEVRLHDPLAALDGGADGLDAYRSIAAGCGASLVEGGVAAMEIGYDQEHAVTEIFAEYGLVRVAHANDLGGHCRALMFAAADKAFMWEKMLGNR